jgi:hypothetical protein
MLDLLVEFFAPVAHGNDPVLQMGHIDNRTLFSMCTRRRWDRASDFGRPGLDSNCTGGIRSRGRWQTADPTWRRYRCRASARRR